MPRTVVPIAKSCHKISSINVISRVFLSKFHQIDMYFHFPRMSFTLKSCKIVAGISTVRQFHKFFKSNFWQVFDIRPYCVAQQQSTATTHTALWSSSSASLKKTETRGSSNIDSVPHKQGSNMAGWTCLSNLLAAECSHHCSQISQILSKNDQDIFVLGD